jgi:glutathione S-transferase
MTAVNLTSSLAATMVRATNGVQSVPAAAKPQQMLQLYDIENCPYCRLVREALTELDVDVEILPCPKKGVRFRPKVAELGGKTQFPCLVDPNTGAVMYESMDIVAYLFETYGQRPLPLKWRAGQLQTMGSMVASALRLNHGLQAKAGRLPLDPLELYSFETSPFARPVRELLCEIEMPYILRSCGRTRLQEWIMPPVRAALNITPNSELANRCELQTSEGKVAIPYLYDPNTKTGLFESTDILAYLRTTYVN